MKFTAQEQQVKSDIEGKVLSFIKKNSGASYRKIRHEAQNLTDGTVLQRKMTWGNATIRKLKLQAGISNPTTRVLGHEKALLDWLKAREDSIFVTQTTTKLIRKQWKKIFTKKPTITALKHFRTKYGIKLQKNRITGNNDCWKLKDN